MAEFDEAVIDFYQDAFVKMLENARALLSERNTLRVALRDAVAENERLSGAKSEIR